LAANVSTDLEPSRLRLFVAVDLPPEARRALGAAQDAFRRRDLASLRWVRPEGIHLTLKFLGETPAGRLDAIREAVAAAARGRAPFRLALGPLGTFGGRRPRVLWVAVEGDLDPLHDLQSAVERGLVAAGFSPEERAYSPHLTLARLPQPPRPEIARRLAEALAEVEPPRAAFAVEEVVLMRSDLRPGGAVYQQLGAFPLR
jgi:2'-5' RNA ligase